MNTDDTVSDSSVLLTQLVVRVTELGRGPPALVRWVSERAGWGLYPTELARVLARTLRGATHPADRPAGTAGEGSAGLADTVRGPGD